MKRWLSLVLCLMLLLTMIPSSLAESLIGEVEAPAEVELFDEEVPEAAEEVAEGLTYEEEAAELPEEEEAELYLAPEPNVFETLTEIYISNNCSYTFGEDEDLSEYYTTILDGDKEPVLNAKLEFTENNAKLQYTGENPAEPELYYVAVYEDAEKTSLAGYIEVNVVPDYDKPFLRVIDMRDADEEEEAYTLNIDLPLSFCDAVTLTNTAVDVDLDEMTVTAIGEGSEIVTFYLNGNEYAQIDFWVVVLPETYYYAAGSAYDMPVDLLSAEASFGKGSAPETGKWCWNESCEDTCTYTVKASEQGNYMDEGDWEVATVDVVVVPTYEEAVYIQLEGEITLAEILGGVYDETYPLEFFVEESATGIEYIHFGDEEAEEDPATIYADNAGAQDVAICLNVAEGGYEQIGALHVLAYDANDIPEQFNFIVGGEADFRIITDTAYVPYTIVLDNEDLFTETGSEGVYTAVQAGKTTVTYSIDSEVVAEVPVTVIDIDLPQTIELDLDEARNNSTFVLPELPEGWFFEISDNTVLFDEEEGILTANYPGETDLYVYDSEDHVYCTIPVKVYGVPTGIELIVIDTAEGEEDLLDKNVYMQDPSCAEYEFVSGIDMPEGEFTVAAIVTGEVGPIRQDVVWDTDDLTDTDVLTLVSENDDGTVTLKFNKDYNFSDIAEQLGYDRTILMARVVGYEESMRDYASFKIYHFPTNSEVKVTVDQTSVTAVRNDNGEIVNPMYVTLKDVSVVYPDGNEICKITEEKGAEWNTLRDPSEGADNWFNIYLKDNTPEDGDPDEVQVAEFAKAEDVENPWQIEAKATGFIYYAAELCINDVNIFGEQRVDVEVTDELPGDRIELWYTYNGKDYGKLITWELGENLSYDKARCFPLGIGEKITLVPRVYVNNELMPDAEISFESVTPSHATCGATSGVVKGKGKGGCTIKITVNDLTYKTKVWVYAAPTAIEADKSSLTIMAGTAYNLEDKIGYTMTPNGTSASLLTLKSSNTNVLEAYVATGYVYNEEEGIDYTDRQSDSYIYGVKAGTATLTLSTFNGLKDTVKVTVKARPTEIKIDCDDEIWLEKGKTLTAANIRTPEDAYTSCYRGSEDESVATFSQKVITAVDYGTTTVWTKAANYYEDEEAIDWFEDEDEKAAAEIALAKLMDTVTVNVFKEKVILGTDKKAIWDGTYRVEEDEDYSQQMGLGEKIRLYAEVLRSTDPENDNSWNLWDDQSVTWTSADKTIATVNAEGVVTAKKVGKVKITAKSAYGKKKTITIEVKKAVTSITLEPNRHQLKIDDELDLTETVVLKPTSAATNEVLWEVIEGAEFVYLNSETGHVTGKKVGKATIQATTLNGKSDVVIIDVYADEADFIEVCYNTDGDIFADEVFSTSDIPGTYNHELIYPVGTEFPLDVYLKAYDENGDDKEVGINPIVEWTSSDESIAKVESEEDGSDAKLVITGTGTVSITVSTVPQDEREVAMSAIATLYIQYAQELEFAEENYDIHTSETEGYNFVENLMVPNTFYDFDLIEWFSTDESVATVDANGVVTAVKEAGQTKNWADIYAYTYTYADGESGVSSALKQEYSDGEASVIMPAYKVIAHTRVWVDEPHELGIDGKTFYFDKDLTAEEVWAELSAKIEVESDGEETVYEEQSYDIFTTYLTYTEKNRVADPVEPEYRANDADFGGIYTFDTIDESELDGSAYTEYAVWTNSGKELGTFTIVVGSPAGLESWSDESDGYIYVARARKAGENSYMGNEVILYNYEDLFTDMPAYPHINLITNAGDENADYDWTMISWEIEDTEVAEIAGYTGYDDEYSIEGVPDGIPVIRAKGNVGATTTLTAYCYRPNEDVEDEWVQAENQNWTWSAQIKIVEPVTSVTFLSEAKEAMVSDEGSRDLSAYMLINGGSTFDKDVITSIDWYNYNTVSYELQDDTILEEIAYFDDENGNSATLITNYGEATAFDATANVTVTITDIFGNKVSNRKALQIPLISENKYDIETKYLGAYYMAIPMYSLDAIEANMTLLKGTRDLLFYDQTENALDTGTINFSKKLTEAQMMMTNWIVEDNASLEVKNARISANAETPYLESTEAAKAGDIVTVNGIYAPGYGEESEDNKAVNYYFTVEMVEPLQSVNFSDGVTAALSYGETRYMGSYLSYNAVQGDSDGFKRVTLDGVVWEEINGSAVKHSFNTKNGSLLNLNDLSYPSGLTIQVTVTDMFGNKSSKAQWMSLTQKGSSAEIIYSDPIYVPAGCTVYRNNNVGANADGMENQKNAHAIDGRTGYNDNNYVNSADESIVTISKDSANWTYRLTAKAVGTTTVTIHCPETNQTLITQVNVVEPIKTVELTQEAIDAVEVEIDYGAANEYTFLARGDLIINGIATESSDFLYDEGCVYISKVECDTANAFKVVDKNGDDADVGTKDAVAIKNTYLANSADDVVAKVTLKVVDKFGCEAELAPFEVLLKPSSPWGNFLFNDKIVATQEQPYMMLANNENFDFGAAINHVERVGSEEDWQVKRNLNDFVKDYCGDGRDFTCSIESDNEDVVFDGLVASCKNVEGATAKITVTVQRVGADNTTYTVEGYFTWPAAPVWTIAFEEGATEAAPYKAWYNYSKVDLLSLLVFTNDEGESFSYDEFLYQYDTDEFELLIVAEDSDNTTVHDYVAACDDIDGLTARFTAVLTFTENHEVEPIAPADIYVKWPELADFQIAFTNADTSEENPLKLEQWNTTYDLYNNLQVIVRKGNGHEEYSIDAYDAAYAKCELLSLEIEGEYAVIDDDYIISSDCETANKVKVTATVTCNDEVYTADLWIEWHKKYKPGINLVGVYAQTAGAAWYTYTDRSYYVLDCFEIELGNDDQTGITISGWTFCWDENYNSMYKLELDTLGNNDLYKWRRANLREFVASSSTKSATKVKATVTSLTDPNDTASGYVYFGWYMKINL